MRAAEALGVRRPKNVRKTLAKLTAVVMAATATFMYTGVANAATLTGASLYLSDSRPYTAGPPTVGNAVSYTFDADSVTLSGIQCIKQVFATTSTGSTVPTGMVTTSATLDTTGTDYIDDTGWSTNVATNGSLFLYDSSSETPANASDRTVVWDAIRNSTSTDSGLFMRFETYTGTFSGGNCQGTLVDNVTVQYVITNGQLLSLTVDGALSFTVAGVTTGGSDDCGTGVTTTTTATGTTIPFESVTASSDEIACQTLTVGTNATNGFTVYIRDTQQLQNSLAQTIADWGGTNASPTVWTATNTEGYAYTTNDTTLGTGDTDRFTDGASREYAAYGHGSTQAANAEIAYANGPTSTAAGVFKVGHKVGITATTEPGAYSTTIVYTCVPVY
jgi:hypothetical protein